MDGDGKISIIDLLKYLMRLPDTDLYLKNDALRLIEYFKEKNAIDSPQNQNNYFLSSQYRSKIFINNDNFSLPGSDSGETQDQIFLPQLGRRGSKGNPRTKKK